MTEYSTILALVAFLGIVIGYTSAKALSSPYKRMRVRRRLMCFLGKHQPGPVEPAVGGRNVQRCEWCDHVCREYQVTPRQAENERDVIRRIY